MLPSKEYVPYYTKQKLPIYSKVNNALSSTYDLLSQSTLNPINYAISPITYLLH
jgi:hypothetical protein